MAIGVAILAVIVVRRDLQNLAAGRFPWAMGGFVGGAVALVVVWLVMGIWYSATGGV
ncbi:MAG: hypothetical protein OXI15_02165 [Chromatiales bacterium]|nr:hypothetical protein [Chromatiales bacterium]